MKIVNAFQQWTLSCTRCWCLSQHLNFIVSVVVCDTIILLYLLSSFYMSDFPLFFTFLHHFSIFSPWMSPIFSLHQVKLIVGDNSCVGLTWMTFWLNESVSSAVIQRVIHVPNNFWFLIRGWDDSYESFLIQIHLLLLSLSSIGVSWTSGCFSRPETASASGFCTNIIDVIPCIPQYTSAIILSLFSFATLLFDGLFYLFWL